MISESSGMINQALAPVVEAFCQNCGAKMTLSSSLKRFCSEGCKKDFDERVGPIRRAKRNLYQRAFRKARYRTEAKHVNKTVCPKCGESGYLVRYTVKNRETGNVVSSYESVRHQLTREGKSVLAGQCYIRSLNIEQEV
jgi:hypothetical protein